MSVFFEQSPLDSPLRLNLINVVRLPNQPETTLTVRLENQSSNATYEVEIHIIATSNSDYVLESWRSPMRKAGKLSSGENQILEFTVLPKNIHDPYFVVNFLVIYEQK